MHNEKTAKETLQEWLRSGCLQSQFEAHMDREAREKNSRYARLIKEKGQDAAREEIRQWNRKMRISEFAAAVESVAQGMLTVANADAEGTLAHVTTRGDGSLYPYNENLEDNTPIVVVLNRLPEDLPFPPPEGWNVWSGRAMLGLKAVTLQAGRSFSGEWAATLGLVMPLRSIEAQVAGHEGFTVATIDLVGSAKGEAISHDGIRHDGFLMHQLGLANLSSYLSIGNYNCGTFDAGIGFPGARDYIANALPELPRYLTALASRLTNHEHSS